jgi:hypothetical protein
MVCDRIVAEYNAETRKALALAHTRGVLGRGLDAAHRDRVALVGLVGNLQSS